MKESSFWDYLRTVLPRNGHYSRIESEVSPGFPDVHFTIDNVSGTIELKSSKQHTAKFPFRSKNDGLRKSQLDWIAEELQCGGRVLLALQRHRTVYILSGERAVMLRDMTKDDLETAALYCWSKGGGFDQERLERVLKL